MKDKQTSSRSPLDRRTAQPDYRDERDKGRDQRRTAGRYKVQDFVAVNPRGQKAYPASVRPLPADSDADPNQPGFSLPARPKRSLRKRLTRNGRAKVYRLKGYTSVAGVKRIRRRQEANMRRLRLIIGLVALGVLIILLIIWNPWSTIAELFRAIGF